MIDDDPDWDSYIEAENDDEIIISPEIRMLPPEEKARVWKIIEEIKQRPHVDPRDQDF